MEKQKKMAAAVAAVTQYVRTEEEAMALQSLASLSPAPAPAIDELVPVKLWGVSGRQSQMQMRNMMQMRTFK